ncbi:hypothetical protein [Echinicola strongylocentroti]|uniref:hypothetical protein n=1 Tax=Echinicola strongylocentroti TaxID=1795355 RepID=UPI0013A6A3BD|nr:hypothetical protein [Echinicola strongylocentroti]
MKKNPLSQKYCLILNPCLRHSVFTPHPSLILGQYLRHWRDVIFIFRHQASAPNGALLRHFSTPYRPNAQTDLCG